MTHLKHSSFSITAAAVFAILGFLFSASAITNSNVMFGDLAFSPTLSWIMTFLMFILSYSALVHLKHDQED